MDKDPTFAPPLSEIIGGGGGVPGSQVVQPSNISGYPNDPTRFLAGDGIWRQPSSAAFLTTFGCDNLANNTEGVPVANRAVLGPVPSLATQLVISTLSYVVNTQSGNLDIGIYYSDDKGVTFRLVVSTGSFAMPAAGAQTKAITQTVLTPVPGRRWYTACSINNITARVLNHPGAPATFSIGYLKTSTFPLPTTITGMSTAVNWFGIIGY
jgi:hypothetical protein